MKLQYISQRRQLIKSFHAGIGKTAVIFPSAFLVALGVGVIGLGIVFYMRDIFNATSSQIGGLASLWAICYISGCIFIRPLFDRFLPRYTIAAATFCMWAATLSILFVNSVAQVYILYGLYGFSNSLFWPHLMAWLSRKVEGARLSKTISKFNFSWSAGLIISPFLAGWLSEISPQLPLYSGSSFFLLTSFMIIGAILALPGIRNDKETERSPVDLTCGKGKDTPVRYPAWAGLFTTYVVIAVILVIFPIYARADIPSSMLTALWDGRERSPNLFRRNKFSADSYQSPLVIDDRSLVLHFFKPRFQLTEHLSHAARMPTGHVVLLAGIFGYVI